MTGTEVGERSLLDAVMADSAVDGTARRGLDCRVCGSPLSQTFVDLGMSPLCESYLERNQLTHMEPFYPLHVYVCERCWLVQLPEHVSPSHIFSTYAYFSSYSDSWLRHARDYVAMVVPRFGLDERSQVIELASNDGYLLQYFADYKVPVLGVEPAGNVAEVAVRKGIPTVVAFFGRQTADDLARTKKQADLLIGNNVLAHVPDVNDFVAGMKRLLAPTGVITMEFPHLVRLMEGNQFDTIYHEHFSYLSLVTVEHLFAQHDLLIFDVQEIPTHGGSLRIYARHRLDTSHPIESTVADLRAREVAGGLTSIESYRSFKAQVHETKYKLLDCLIRLKREGRTVVGYGAPGKGNTLLNYCGIRQDFLDYTVDRNPYKQGKYLPGTHIPIVAPDTIKETRPDYVLILPWNIKNEIMEQMSFIRSWGGQFIVPIPEVEVCP